MQSSPIAIIIIILAAALLFVLMRKTNILKDQSTCVGIKPFSLSRVQLSLWSLVIFSSFVYLIDQDGFIITSGFSLNDTTLILLGISGATTVMGSTIDTSDIKNPDVASRHQDGCSQGFWLDILSDANGISIHRYQNVIFTGVLLIAYVVFVINKNQMPEWDGTLMTLMGISSAGYIGVKMNENK